MIVFKPTAKFYLACNYAITMFLGFISIKIILNAYSIEQYTLLLVLQATIGLSNVLDYGLMNNLIINISSLQNKVSINTYLENHFIIFKWVLIASACTFLAICLVIMLTNNNSHILNIGKMSVVLFVFPIIIGIINYLKNLYDALGRFIEFSLINTGYSILSFILLIYITKSEYDIENILYAYVVSGFVIILIIIVRLKNANIYLPFRMFPRNKDYSRNQYLSGNLQFASIIGFSIDPLFKLMLSLFGYSSLIITFEIAKRVTNGISGIYSNTIRFLLPKFASENILYKNKIEITSLLNEQYKYIFYFIILTYGCMYILFYLLGEYYNNHQLINLINILLISEIIIIGSGLFYLILLSSNNYRQILFIQVQNISVIMTLGVIISIYTNSVFVFVSFIFALALTGVYSYQKVKSLFTFTLDIARVKYFRKYIYILALLLSISIINLFMNEYIWFYGIISGISLLTLILKRNTITSYFFRYEN